MLHPRKLADNIIASLRKSPVIAAGVLYRIAGLHGMVGRPGEVWSTYDEIDKTHGTDDTAPQATLQIGFTHEEAGEKEKAIRTVQLTCRRHPKSAEAARAHAHLQEKYSIHVTLGGATEK